MHYSFSFILHFNSFLLLFGRNLSPKLRPDEANVNLRNVDKYINELIWEIELVLFPLLKDIPIIELRARNMG